MKKIPCLFQRDFSTQPPVLLQDVTPGCEWVLEGQGVATWKRDGTACLVRAGQLWARYDAKRGKVPPAGWEACQPAADPVTGHWPGWVLVTDQPEYRWHRDADLEGLEDGTYELCGPKIGANAEKVTGRHVLIRHGAEHLYCPNRDFLGFKLFLEQNNIEGIVFHHPDGRMAKIRRDDYGFPWGAKR